jgi:hypothetical protein
LKTLTVVRAVVFVLLALYLLLFAMPWTYVPLLFANVDTQAILTRAELRRVMAPLIAAAALAVAWNGLDAYLGILLWRRERRAAEAQGPSTPPASGAARK